MYYRQMATASLTVNLGILAIFKYLDQVNLASLKFDSAPELDTFGLLFLWAYHSTLFKQCLT